MISLFLNHFYSSIIFQFILFIHTWHHSFLITPVNQLLHNGNETIGHNHECATYMFNTEFDYIRPSVCYSFTTIMKPSVTLLHIHPTNSTPICTWLTPYRPSDVFDIKDTATLKIFSFHDLYTILRLLISPAFRSIWCPLNSSWNCRLLINIFFFFFPYKREALFCWCKLIKDHRFIIT